MKQVTNYWNAGIAGKAVITMAITILYFSVMGFALWNSPVMKTNIASSASANSEETQGE